MKKTILLAATMAAFSFGAARAAETIPTEAPKTAPAVTGAITTPMAAMAAPRPGDHLTSKLIGADVYARTGEKVGDVNDLIVDPTGKVSGVVVGVGGFLGVGEKAVALPFTALMLGADATGAARLTVDVTKEALQNAPTFKAARS